MERELWPLLYPLLREVGADFRQTNVTFQPWVIVAVLLWAALHDRSRSWACQRRHWSTTRRRPHRLPCEATISRRANDIAVGLLLRALEERLRAATHPGLRAFIDGKPLLVGGSSKDPDAKFGRGAGHMAKGYKLHTIWSHRAVPEAWEVTPLNVNEKVVARALLGQAGGTGYLLGDGNYDGNELFDVAARHGYQLVVPLFKPSAGQGHHYQSPHRLRCIDLLRGEFGRSTFGGRGNIERSFGNAGSFGGGLGPLPNWVRRLHRVRLWVWAKLLINGVRILQRQRLAA
jgi:hypothetical protein